MSTTSRPRKSVRRTSPPVLAGSENSGAGWPKRRPVMASQYILRARSAAFWISRGWGPAVRGEPMNKHRNERTPMKDSETYRKGAEMRRRLLGDAFVDRSTKTVYADPVMSKFIDVATETIFGMLWTRPGLDLKTRKIVCVVSDAATGREPELAIHLRMALRQGWTEEELTEALIQLVGYVGAPFARDALIVASRVFGEMRGETARA